MSDPKHCAKFTDSLLPVARHMLACVAGLPVHAWGLDPMAGTGKGVDYLRETCGFNAWGIELEPEWADASRHVIRGDALHLPWTDSRFDFVFTSPTYGNRMADKDMRESVAGTYAKSLGRIASDASSCHMQWGVGMSGDRYRAFHVDAWTEARRTLKDDGWFLLNIKNHIRGGEEQLVSEWHGDTLTWLGFDLVASEFVETTGVRHGANGDARVDGEWLHLFQLGGK